MVVDEAAIPIEGAIVQLISEKKGQPLRQTMCLPSGTFALRADSGRCRMIVQMIGYQSYRTRLNVESDMLLDTIKMVVDETLLQEITIRGRKEKPIIKVSGSSFEVNVATTYLSSLGNAFDILKHAPAINVTNQGGISLTSLGNAVVYVNHKKVLLNGEDLVAYLRSIPASSIEKVEATTQPDATYSSEGIGGVVNIVLNSKNEEGLFFTTSHGISYWKNLKESSSLALDLNREKWKMGFSYGQQLGHYSMKYGCERWYQNSVTDSRTDDTDKRNGYSMLLALAYRPALAHSILFSSSANVLAGPGKTSTHTLIAENNLPKGILTAENNYLKQRNVRLNQALAYNFKPSAAHFLDASFDWTHFRGISENDQPNRFYTSGGVLEEERFYFSQPKKTIDIFAFLSNYKYNPSEGQKLDAGIKVSWIQSDNDFLFQRNGILDKTRSNDFQYSENNIETYLQYHLNIDKWHIDAGLRGDYMRSKGKLKTYKIGIKSKEHSFSKFQLFPVVNISYQLRPHSKLMLAYSRRQDKPRYEDLNPFEFLLDDYTYWKGNPFLKPQISNRISAVFSHKKISFTSTYTSLDNYMSSITVPTAIDKIIMTTENLGKQEQWDVSAMYGERLFQWWNLSTSFTWHYLINRLNMDRLQTTLKRPSYSLSLSSSISLPAAINLDISSRFHSKRMSGNYETLKSSGSVDVGLHKAFCSKRVKLAVLMTDIFHTERWDSYSQIPHLRVNSWGYGESRRVVLRLSYTFGQRKTNEKRETIDEINRL